MQVTRLWLLFLFYFFFSWLISEFQCVAPSTVFFYFNHVMVRISLGLAHTFENWRLGLLFCLLLISFCLQKFCYFVFWENFFFWQKYFFAIVPKRMSKHCRGAKSVKQSTSQRPKAYGAMNISIMNIQIVMPSSLSSPFIFLLLIGWMHIALKLHRIAFSRKGKKILLCLGWKNMCTQM